MSDFCQFLLISGTASPSLTDSLDGLRRTLSKTSQRKGAATLLWMYDWIARFGYPLKFTTVRGCQFEPHLFRAITSMVGSQHFHMTAFHPAANGMVERLHRQLKGAIMCHSTTHWTEVLPLIHLGIRSARKADIQASPADLVYGEPLRLPGQFFASTDDHNTAEITDLATRLRSHMNKLTPKPASWHRKAPCYIPRQLDSSSHVLLRQDFVRRPLEPPYACPYKVLERHPKYYKLDVRGKEMTVSEDWLKPAFLTHEDSTTPSPSPPWTPTEEPVICDSEKRRCGR